MPPSLELKVLFLRQRIRRDATGLPGREEHGFTEAMKAMIQALIIRLGGGQFTPGRFTPGPFTPGQFTPGLIIV